MSVQLLDKTRKINKLLHNSSSSKVVFNDICQVLMDTLSSNILVLSKKGKVLGISLCPGVEEITELIEDNVGGHVDSLLNERFLGVLSTKENVNLQTLGFEHVNSNCQGIINPIDIAGERLGTVFMYRNDKPYDIEDIIVSEYGTTVVGLEMMRAVHEENAEEDTIEEKAASAQASIEEVLDEWEKTKHAAEIAIAAAEQKKLEISKEHALVEAGEIMERLKTLIPILSATPGEEIPVPEDTVAAALVPDESEKAEAKEDLEETAEAESETEETKEAAETVETESQIEPETEKAADEETVVEAAEPSVEAADAELEDVEEEAPVEEKEDLSTTKEMPDLKAARTEKTAETEEEAEAEEEPKEEKRLSVVEPVPDEELEKVLAQATQMFVENANVEVPVTGTAPTGVSQNTGVLPEIQMPDDIEEDKKELTEEQKELLSYFLPVPGMEDQIRQVLLGAKTRIGNSVTSLAGNILIQGEEGSGKTVFATSLIKAIQKEIGNEDAKIGKISAESLNHKDFAALIPKIEGGYLIVDKAGQLTAETAAYMSQVMEQNTQGMVVILEDTRAGIRKVMNLDFGFTKKFTEKIDIPIFTIDELVDFGKSYAKEMECTIDEMGVLALYNRINNIQKLDRATTLAEVKDIVDEAIEKAEGSGIKKAFGSIFSKKYNENDYLILHEKDFE